MEYFVSYYDYYQPEAYVPSSDTFIEKDSAVNEQIDQMRLSAVKSFGAPRYYCCGVGFGDLWFGRAGSLFKMRLILRVGSPANQREILSQLAGMQYTRNDRAFQRGTFRVRGDVIDIFPAESDDQSHSYRII